MKAASVAASANLPMGTLAQVGAEKFAENILKPIALFKWGWDISVTTFSGVVCSIGR